MTKVHNRTLCSSASRGPAATIGLLDSWIIKNSNGSYRLVTGQHGEPQVGYKTRKLKAYQSNGSVKCRTEDTLVWHNANVFIGTTFVYTVMLTVYVCFVLFFGFWLNGTHFVRCCWPKARVPTVFDQYILWPLRSFVERNIFFYIK